MRPDRNGIGGWIRIERPVDDMGIDKEKDMDGWEVIVMDEACEDWTLL